MCHSSLGGVHRDRVTAELDVLRLVLLCEGGAARGHRVLIRDPIGGGGMVTPAEQAEHAVERRLDGERPPEVGA